MRKDLEWLYACIPRKFEHLGPPQQTINSWVRFIHDNPGPWKALVQLALDAHVQQLALSAASQAASAPVPPSPDLAAPLDLVQHFEFRCEECQFSAPTAHGIAVHRAKKHGYVHPARLYSGPSPTCRVCMVHFWTRARLVRHLREERQRRATPLVFNF